MKKGIQLHKTSNCQEVSEILLVVNTAICCLDHALAGQQAHAQVLISCVAEILCIGLQRHIHVSDIICSIIDYISFFFNDFRILKTCGMCIFAVKH